MKPMFTTPFEVEVGGAPLEGGLSPRSALETLRQASKTSFDLLMKNPVTFVLVPYGLFVLLAPAFILSLPRQSDEFCFKTIPLPTGSTQADCATATSTTPIKPICDARVKCQQVQNPMSVEWAPVLAHAAVFTVVVAIAQRFAYSVTR